MKNDFMIGARLSAQRALLGEVFPALDQVDLSCEPGVIELHFFLSAPPTEDDLESISCIETEMTADYYPEVEIRSVYSVVDKNVLGPRGHVCIFARRSDRVSSAE